MPCMNFANASARSVVSWSVMTRPSSMAAAPSEAALIAAYKSYHGPSATWLRAFTGLLFHEERGSADSSSWPKSANPEVISCAIVENAHDG